MHGKTTLLIFCSLLFFSTCKKKSEANCGINKHFESGTCICNDGWFGWDCEKSCAECGPHGQCYEDWCVCDSGWVGDDCIVPIYAFAGRYHVAGSSVTFSGGTTFPPVYIDDTLEISILNDTLLARGYKHRYFTAYSMKDTAVYFQFLDKPYSNNYSLLFFNKVLNDSVGYQSRSGGLGGGTTINLSGKKI